VALCAAVLAAGALGQLVRERDAAAAYRDMTTEELQAATAEFGREMILSKSPPRGRGKRLAASRDDRKEAQGVKVIPVSVERGLLTRSGALARNLGISRAALIERGPETTSWLRRAEGTW
jgi:hypothetical protein